MVAAAQHTPEVSTRETNSHQGEHAARTAAQFATTHWSVVLTAADSAAPEAQEAAEWTNYASRFYRLRAL